MHELHIAEHVVEILDGCRAGRAVSLVQIQIGRRRNVVPDTLQFCFELATVGTPLEGTRLEIRMRPGRDLIVKSVEMV